MAWAVPKGETRVVDFIRYVGEDMERIAVPICHSCAQQWLCARWAIEVDERTGTWAMPYERLKWLKRQTDALAIIDSARVNEIPVDTAVQVIRRHRV